VKQGDPLSPLLFAIGADILQMAINQAFDQGVLLPPFPQHLDTHFLVIQYANDTILIMKACDSQLVALVSLK
jgi:hypothetical protein